MVAERKYITQSPETLGQQIENRLIDLARIGGISIEPQDGRERFEVKRLALSPEDVKARGLLTHWMEEAGMCVTQHPLGLIGVYPGRIPQLATTYMMSHYDSVPTGGMYDGTVGVVAGIEVVRQMRREGTRPNRSVGVIALTGEESARFKMALFGSRGMFHGLTETELDAQAAGDVSLREALRTLGVSEDTVKKPFIHPKDVHAIVELHVSQDGNLERKKVDLAVIEAIAAADRYDVVVGDPLQGQERKQYPFEAYYRLGIEGKTGHSGATPMGTKYRADGLVPAAGFMIRLGVLQNRLRAEQSSVNIVVGNVTIDKQSINQIPGKTNLIVGIRGESGDEVFALSKHLMHYTSERNRRYKTDPTSYEGTPLSFEPTGPKDNITFFEAEHMLNHHMVAGMISTVVQSISTTYGDRRIVGTVGTYDINDKGQVILGLDIRGIHKDVRSAAVGDILSLSHSLARRNGVSLDTRRLAGSGDPINLDPDLVAQAREVIEQNNIGSYEVTFSPAGHDTGNAARAGIPSVMLFIPSRNGGVSHNPQEYSTSEDLERGTRALSALIHRLAS